MKYTSIIVSILIIAAVLIAAYAVGLLVRQARMDDVPPQAAAVEPNDTIDTATKMALEQQLPGARPVQPPESPVQAKSKRERTLETMNDMTEKEKHQFTTKQVRNRFSASGKGRYRNLSPEEREKMMQNWQSLSEEQKQAIREREAQRSREPRNGESEIAQPGGTMPAQNESEPNQPDQG